MTGDAIRQLGAVWLLPLLTAFLNQSMHGQGEYKVIQVKDGGTISGTVRLGAKPPASEPYPITKNPDHCGTVKQTDRLILGKDNAVKNAIVSLEGVTEGKAFPPYVKPVLDQHKCEYVPHVQVLPLGSPLEIVNSDEILHNVHAYAVEENYRTVCNIAQPIKGQRTTVKPAQLSKPGLVLMTCDAGHPWMTAYVLIAEHPYYAVTDVDGRYNISNVPPGNYRVKMWHEGVTIVGKDIEKGVVKKYHFEEAYVSTKDVVVEKGKTVKADFELLARE